MDWGNRFFWGFMAWVAVELLWLRFVETFLPIWVGALVGLAVLVITMYLLKRQFPLPSTGPRTGAAGEAP